MGFSGQENDTLIHVLVGSHVHLFAEGIQALLKDDKAISLQGIVTGKIALKEALAGDVDVVIADKVMCEYLFHEHTTPLQTRVLMINDCPGLSTLEAEVPVLIRNGLAGILSCCSDRHLLSKAIRVVASGELWLDNETVRKSLCSMGRDEILLTPREEKVLEHLHAGHTNKEIAERLFISEHTVKTHCRHLFKKFGVNSRVQLVIATTPNHH